MRKALYRSYRPRRFSQVLGQDLVCQALKNQAAAGRVGHAYIFTGIRGTGKTTLAKILAKAVNCLDPKDGEPCGECEVCRGIDAGTITDVTEIDAASNTGVDNIRELREESAYTPVVCRRRVYIIDEVHMLSQGAWAALLKIMEEPPEHVMFILATTEIQKVPATVLSRCQRFDLHRIGMELLVENILRVSGKENIPITREAAEAIARLADGAMRDALSLLETCAAAGEEITLDTVRRLTGMVDRGYLEEFSTAIAAGDVAAALSLVDRLYRESMDPGRLALELTSHMRDLLMAKLGVSAALEDRSPEQARRLKELAEPLRRQDILRWIKLFGELYGSISSSPDRRLSLELAVMKACGPAAAEGEREQPRAAEKPAAPRPAPAGSAATPAGEAPFPLAPEPEEPPETAPDEELPPILPKRGDSPPPDGYSPVEGWESVISAMREINGLFYGFLIGTRAYTTSRHLLIEGSDIFFKYMRENPADRDRLKQVISEKLGINLPIGPYRPQESVAQPAPDRSLDQFLDLARKGSIPVEFLED